MSIRRRTLGFEYKHWKQDTLRYSQAEASLLSPIWHTFPRPEQLEKQMFTTLQQTMTSIGCSGITLTSIISKN